MTLVLPPNRSSPLRRAAFSAFEGAKAHLRVLLRGRQLQVERIRPGLSSARLVLVLVIRDEADRVPFFLDYYRRLGVQEFVVIDNGSSDDLDELIREAPDVSLLRAAGSYRKARYGNDWVNGVLGRYCRDKWILYVDVDEFLVYEDSEHRTLGELLERLEAEGRRAVSARMLDMYSDRAVAENRYRRGSDPLATCDLFDTEGYESQYEEVSLTTWIKGGPRGRVFFEDAQLGPALNKIPLVRWSRGFAYLKSSHQLWPLSLNREATRSGITGALLHQKFLASFAVKVEDPDHLGEHTSEYIAYHGAKLGSSFIGASTARFRSSMDLVKLGIMRTLGW